MSAHKIMKKMEEQAEVAEQRLLKGGAQDYPEYQGLVHRARGFREAIEIVREGVRIADAGTDD